MIEAYPLHWPPTWPRTQEPQSARFSFGRSRSAWRDRGAAGGAAKDNLLLELDRLGASNIIISTNVPVRRDGLPYARAKKPEDCGVAVYFQMDGEQRCFPCDRWDRVGDNIHAIALSVGALRGLDRWGAKQMVDAAFRGFKALSAGPQWWQVLGLKNDQCNTDQIKSAYRKKASQVHPDKGGSNDEMSRLNEAYSTGMELAT
ncbi:J domain-containing protein [Acidobacteria bacterium AH-259-A15]|nr:J domain-containing protein [Acidobacteria bacterium AH-259-A15]